jgi:hypothetical protein
MAEAAFANDDLLNRKEEERVATSISDHAMDRLRRHRYLAEFDFRYNHRVANGMDDVSRAQHALKGAKGKRLTYRRTSEFASARA